MNTTFFIKKAVRHALRTWKPAGVVECPGDLVSYFDPVEMVEILVALFSGEYKEIELEDFYAICNLVIDEAVEVGDMKRGY